jgi:tripartite-type tricarboxylate transporter receptor subunit TctC
MARVNIVRVNYKGVSTAITDVTGGRVQVMVLGASAVKPYTESGKLKVLAVTSLKPSALFPKVPTVSASGLPGYEYAAQFGMFAPAKTPAAVVSRLNQEIVRLLARSDVKEKFFNAGMEPVGNTPEQFGATVKSEMAKWGKVIRDADIRAD